MKPTLLDEIVPHFDFGNRHERLIAAPPALVAEAIEAATTAADSPWFVRLLTRLRGIPDSGRSLRQGFLALGFSVLGEDPGREVVFGVAGRFWAWDELKAIVRVADADAFRSFDRPGHALAAMNMCLEPRDGGRSTRLVTETRVRCVDRGAYLRFGAYWMLIRPFSGLIRHAMLRGVATRAEGRVGPGHALGNGASTAGVS